MANRLKGEHAIVVEGKEYILLLDVNALIEIEEETGVSADHLNAEYTALVSDPTQPKKTARLRELFRLALLQRQPGITLEKTGDLMTGLGGYLPSLMAFSDAINAAYPVAEKEGAARPRKGRGSRGTG